MECLFTSKWNIFFFEYSQTSTWTSSRTLQLTFGCQHQQTAWSVLVPATALCAFSWSSYAGQSWTRCWTVIFPATQMQSLVMHIFNFLYMCYLSLLSPVQSLKILITSSPPSSWQASFLRQSGYHLSTLGNLIKNVLSQKGIPEWVYYPSGNIWMNALSHWKNLNESH